MGEKEPRKKRLHPAVTRALKKVPDSITDTLQFVPEYRRLSRLELVLYTPGLSLKQQLSVIALERKLAELEIAEVQDRAGDILNRRFTI